MKTILLAASVACLAVSSCGSNSQQEVYVPKDSSGKPITVNTNIPARDPKQQPAAVQPGAPQMNTQVNTQANPAQQQQDIQRQIQEQIQQQQAKMAAANAAPTPKGMNPPHGQPGHRCDIAVGAPLNSKPVVNPTTTQIPVSTTQPGQTVTTTQQPVVTAPGMNPPHGQPNHRCDIAVGAPLNSKPVPPVTTTPTVTTTTAATPAKKDSGQ